MARLPSIDRRNPTTQVPTSSVSSADVIRSEGAMAAGLQRAGQAMGSLSAAVESYENLAEDGYLAKQMTDIERSDDDRRRQHLEDPDGYRKSSEAYSAEILKNAPSERARLKLERGLTALQSDGERKIRDGVFSRGLKRAENDLDVRYETATDRAAGLARAGDTGGQEYANLTAEITSINNERVKSPLSTYTQAQADRDSKRAIDTLQIEGVYGTIERGWSSTQGDPDQKYAALADTLRKQLDDPKLAFDSAERKRLESQGLSMLRNMRAEAKANNNELRAEAVSTVQMLQADSSMADDPSMDDLGGRLRAAGLHREALTLERVRSGAKILGPYINAPSEEREAIRREVVQSKAPARGRQLPSNIASTIDGAAARYGEDANTLKAIAFLESGGKPGAKNPSSSAGGTFQFIDSTAESYGLKDRYDPAQAADAAARLLRDNRAYLTKRLGRDVTPGELYLAHQQGSEGARKLLANPDALAKDVVGLEAVQGNLPGNHRRRANTITAREFAGIWTQKVDGLPAVSGDGAPTAFDSLPKEVRAEFQKDAADSVRTSYASVKEGLNQGIMPSAETVQSMVEQFPLIADRGLVDEIRQTLETAGVVTAATAADRPIDEQRGDIANLRSGMEAQGSDPVGIQLLGLGEKLLEANEKTLREDPLAMWDRSRTIGNAGQRLGQLDYSNPQALQAELQKRVAASRFVSEQHEIGPVPVLRPTELPAFESKWRSGTVEERVNLLSVLTSSLPPEVLMSTLAQFAGKDSTSTLAWAGAIQSKNAEVAQSIVRGSAIMEAEKGFTWSEDSTTRVEISERWPDLGVGGWQASSAMMKATQARYADLSNQAGDRSGKINTDRFDQALNDVSGGVVEYNGSRVVAPSYGMSQDAFDDRMSALAQTDVLGAVTKDGKPIPPRVIQNHGKLVSVADGRYLVRFGDGDSAWFASMADGRPFQLDLRDRE